MNVIYSAKGPEFPAERTRSFALLMMWREFWNARELIRIFFVRDFSARYRQSALGILWAIMLPVVSIAAFMGMHVSGILNIAELEVPYPLYAIIGVTIWGFFSTGLTACSNALVQAGPMIMKINFSKVALIFSATGQSIVELLIRMVLISIAFLYYGVAPNWTGLILAPICIIPLYLFMTGMGFMFSLIAAVIRDIANVLNIALMGFMLLTPVIYPITGSGILVRFNNLNPLNYLVNVPRDLIFTGQTGSLRAFILVSAVSAIVFFIGWRLFYLAQARIAERI
jgi:lipopolysaccharide transport system permease protein